MTQNIGKSYWATSVGGTASTLVATIPGLDSLKHADIYIIPTPLATTGALTIDINGLGAVPVKTPSSADPSAMPANYEMLLIWNTSEFVLQNAVAGASSPQMVFWGGTATTTASTYAITVPLKTGALVAGEIYEFSVSFSVTSVAPSIDINGTVVPMIRTDGTALTGGPSGEIKANAKISGYYNGTSFVVVSHSDVYSDKVYKYSSYPAGFCQTITFNAGTAGTPCGVPTQYVQLPTSPIVALNNIPAPLAPAPAGYKWVADVMATPQLGGGNATGSGLIVVDIRVNGAYTGSLGNVINYYTGSNYANNYFEGTGIIGADINQTTSTPVSFTMQKINNTNSTTDNGLFVFRGIEYTYAIRLAKI